MHHLYLLDDIIPPMGLKGRESADPVAGALSASRAVVVIGDEKGKVGVGTATAKEVIEAVQKAVTDAKKHLIQVRSPITLPCAVGFSCAPASSDTNDTMSCRVGTARPMLCEAGL